MKKRQIINIINFIRAVEPWDMVDLETPVREQIRLMKKHGLRGTFLLQYDALLKPVYVDLMKSLDPAQFEIGVWFETVQPQVEKVGLEWTGRFPWDWHPHCGFSVGYTKEQREKLVDVLFEEFKSIFGYYPRVFGSWFYDTHTVRYILEKYGIDAMCNCKEQFGTDGYTMWGGYYGQAYYPSRNNVFMPAQSKENQLPVPIFRMLGSDPVYQYDLGLDIETGANKIQTVISLEPVYRAEENEVGGGVPEWVDWFMRENFNGDCLTFGYAQAGQENTFGWYKMGEGLTYQFAEFERLQKEGKITVETLGESGRWFKETYSATPASAITAHTAYDDPEKNSVWYCSKNYRVNLYCDHGNMRVRDIHVFSDRHIDPYENAVCPGTQSVYETLPVVDGNRHTGGGILGGAYLSYVDGTPVNIGDMTFTDCGEGRATVSYGDVSFELHETGMRVTANRPFRIDAKYGTDDHLPAVQSLDEDKLSLEYDGVGYSLKLLCGRFDSETCIMSDGCTVEIEFEA